MPEYLIAFNGEWVPDYTDEEMAERSKAVRALRTEMKAAGVYVFLGGLDDSVPVFSVDASGGAPSSPMVPTPRPKSTSEASRSSMWPTRRRLECGRKGCSRLRLAAGGPALPVPPPRPEA